MKSVKNSNSNLSMQNILSSDSNSTENPSIDCDKQVREYWNNIFEVLCNSNNEEKVESVVKQLYTISVRIGQSLANPESNLAFSEWVLLGLKGVKDSLDELSRSTSSETEYHKTISLLQRVMVVLKKSIQKYFEKPHSNTHIEHKKAEIIEYSECLSQLLSSGAQTCEIPVAGEPGNSVNLDNSSDDQQAITQHKSTLDSPKKGAIFEERSDELLEHASSSGETDLDLGVTAENNNEKVLNSNPSLACEDETSSKLQITTVPEIVGECQPNTQQEESGGNSDSEDTTDCRTLNSYSPKCKTSKSISSRSDTTDRTMSSIKSYDSLPPFRGYATRNALRKHRRRHRQKIKILEKENEVKDFYKRKMITTDFKFNPRFDTPKRKRDSKVKEEFDSVLFVTEGTTINFSNDESSPKKIVNVKGILKPNPLKQPFFC